MAAIRSHSFPATAVAIVVASFGIAFVGLGGWLAALGGSRYYVVAGIALVVGALLIVRRRPIGAWLYLATFVATVAWAVAEVGFDGWKLLPRVFALALLGLLVSAAFAWRPVTRTRAVRIGVAVYALAIVATFALGWSITASRTRVFATAPGASVAVADASTDWRYYGRTPAGQRWSPADQITPANVDGLALAWRYDTGDTLRAGENEAGREFNVEVTPIKVGDRLYVCTPHRHVIALDATSGRKIWEYDPRADLSANEYLACRGVAYVETPTARCPRRIVTTSANAQLIALDADDGHPCEDFGDHGAVSLTDHMGAVPPGFHYITSQPLILRGRIVLGGWIYDNQATGEPSGVVRAYDAATGRLAWAWDVGRQDPVSPLAEGETYTRGTPNAWGTYTADPALGLIYLPLGNATPDYYGPTRRPFDDEYSSSVVALDIETGRERWHFQTVHHDVWDFDVPIGPSLVDLPMPDGSTVPALVQTTKMGDVYLLDRRTGKPLIDVVERPVPQHGLPGEHLSATQPFPEGFPSFAPDRLEEADTWGATPIDQLLCRIRFRSAHYEGRYTPPALGTSIAYPAFDGVVDWYGGSIDPTRRLLVANTSYIPFTMEAMTTDEGIARGLMKPWAGWHSGDMPPKPKEFAVGPQYGTPFVVVVKPWLGVLQAPCMAPPWGGLVAVDLATRKVVWQRPVGTTRDMNVFGLHTNVPLPTGIFTIGGNTITKSGLIFMGATADDYLRAFDERTGAELWRARLPAGGQATPMTYVGSDGRQYVVIAAGGHGGLRTRPGDSIVAYALPTS